MRPGPGHGLPDEVVEKNLEAHQKMVSEFEAKMDAIEAQNELMDLDDAE